MQVSISQRVFRSRDLQPHHRNDKKNAVKNKKAIAGNETAGAYFDERGYGFGSGSRLPKIKELQEKYAIRNIEKKILWVKYHEVKNAGKEVENA